MLLTAYSAHTPYPGGSMISEAASTPQALAYLAGQPQMTAEFSALISNFTSVFRAATAEIEAMVSVG